MNYEKKTLLGMLIITVFVFIVAFSSLYVQMQIETGNICGCAIPVYLFIPLLASIGLFIGVLVYYLLLPEFEKPKIGTDVFLGVFPDDQKSILRVVLNHKGSVSQRIIGRETGFSKVKVHRIIESLVTRNILIKEQKGKINIIKLNDKLRDIL
ncbi:MAG: hypothetical protein DRP13_03140 [Candidatus Aenigmatarchaeota archaeon]|nr:MAG: hypothetical protein DRP13_03140 [Candidatus Aenigmarchaeota archaeon]